MCMVPVIIISQSWLQFLLNQLVFIFHSHPTWSLETHPCVLHIPLLEYIGYGAQNLSCLYKIDCNLSINQPVLLFQSRSAQWLKAYPRMQHMLLHRYVIEDLRHDLFSWVYVWRTRISRRARALATWACDFFTFTSFLNELSSLSVNLFKCKMCSTSLSHSWYKDLKTYLE